jgi:hypothetical protein
METPSSKMRCRSVAGETGRAILRDVARSPLTPLDRFYTKVNRDGPLPERHPEAGPCHLWTASCFGSGYGQFKVDGQNVRAHRWLWRQLRGPLTDEEVLDHWACDRPPCVNLGHLRPTTQAENLHRSPITVASINAAKAHGPCGHPYDAVRMVSGYPARYCSGCERARQREAKRAQRARLRDALPFGAQ